MASDGSLLKTLDTAIVKFDAFPKLPSAYKARSESRGFMTIGILFVAVLLLLNDLGEYLYGWPDFSFAVDKDKNQNLKVNVDMVVAMPCSFISVDLRDALGDRLMLAGTVRRDGVWFDVGQATTLQEHARALSVQQAISQSRQSRGLFDVFRSRSNDGFRPTYKHQGDGSACRIVGSLDVRRVTANLHITTIGHGYASYEHIDHKQMNLSHVISEFSFGPFFPDITQPLDNSYEVTDKHFIAYQYFLHVVPTTYVAPRSEPLSTAQYSVTHYTRELDHDQGVPGIFFKFDLDPLAITINQRTTSFLQFLVRCAGVLGGVFVCMGYAIRVTSRAVAAVVGQDNSVGIVAAESSGVKLGLRSKWTGGEIRARNKSGKLIPQGNGWTMDNGGSPYTGGGSPYSSYNNSPVSANFSPIHSPYLNPSAPSSPHLGVSSLVPAGLPPPPRTPGFGPPPRSATAPSFPGTPNPPAYGSSSPLLGGSQELLVSGGYLNGGGYGSQPGSPAAGYASFPAGASTPPPPGSTHGGSFNMGAPPPRRAAKKDD